MKTNFKPKKFDSDYHVEKMSESEKDGEQQSSKQPWLWLWKVTKIGFKDLLKLFLIRNGAVAVAAAELFHFQKKKKTLWI